MGKLTLVLFPVMVMLLQVQAGSHSTYIRFGRSDCPDVEETELVYSGRAAKSLFNDVGGGANYLCLPDDPQYASYREGVQGYSSIYGVEYQDPLQNCSLHDFNVPCAVCNANGRSGLLMIPARLECPTNWTLEYTGYLMAERNNHTKSTFECVDQDAEVIPKTGDNENGGLFYNVEAVCVGLDCPPYIASHELTCVVCTR